MMEEKKDQLLAGAAEVFMKYGFKSVNMDDMARHLGISKKTLYKFFRDKNDLVDQAVNHFSCKEDECIKAICGQGQNAIDEAFEVMNMVLKTLTQVHPSIIFDLQKYHPGVFERMMADKQSRIYDCMHSNMRSGMEQGLYRDDLNADLMTRIYIGSVNGMFDTNLFPPGGNEYREIYIELFRYHIRGIASDRGREYLVEKVKQLKSK
jgi:TetR/AcrR family transcriptional regulator, cholesterol catabolism regulator